MAWPDAAPLLDRRQDLEAAAASAVEFPQAVDQEVELRLDHEEGRVVADVRVRPAARLRLDAGEVRAGEALLAFGPTVPKHAAAAINLSPSGDLEEAAAGLSADELARRLKGMCGLSAAIEIARPGALERSMGKARRVIDRRPKA